MNDKIIISGATLATPMKRPNMLQENERKSDYIINNPLVSATAKVTGNVLVVNKEGKPEFAPIVQVGYGDMKDEASIQILGIDEDFEDGPDFVTFESGATLALKNETEYRSESDITSLTLYLPTDPAIHFMCSLEFDTGATASVDFNFINGSHYITGDACVGGVFNPKGSMHYSLLLWYDGSRMQGVARGVAL